LNQPFIELSVHCQWLMWKQPYAIHWASERPIDEMKFMNNVNILALKAHILVLENARAAHNKVKAFHRH